MAKTTYELWFVFGSLALLSTGCSSHKIAQRVPQRCVTDDGHVMDDWYCDDEGRRTASGQNHFPARYHWYWGGPTTYIPSGSVVRGGTYAPPRSTSGVEIFSPGPSGPRPTGLAISPGAGAQRGLFGSSAHSFGEAGGGE
jgi:hypothetical protein